MLGFGLYMAGEHDLYGESWVQVGITAIVLIAVIGGWVVGASKRMAELSAADVAKAGPEGAVAWGADYERLYRRYIRVEELLGAIVLVAVFFMVAKP